mgnify:CR=1 FL=1
MKRIKIFDTTLRDGEQSPGCSMNLTEKIEMARQLEKLGVDVIEAGFAIASPMDHKSVQAIAAAVTNCTVASLARCAKGDIDAAWDAVKEANHPRIHVFLATSDIHMEYKLKMTPDERAKAGIFLAMQYPVEVPGVSMTNFLRTAKTEVDGKAPAIRTWTKELSEAMKRLKMDPKFATRSVNEGFSGGEKKRAEVLQLELLKPKFAILDETDSGLDVDALRIVSEGVNRAKEANQFGILMVTHYTRILRYIKPDIVHVFADGHFIKTGGPELADELEEPGYDAYLPEGSDSESALA